MTKPNLKAPAAMTPMDEVAENGRYQDWCMKLAGMIKDQRGYSPDDFYEQLMKLKEFI